MQLMCCLYDLCQLPSKPASNKNDLRDDLYCHQLHQSWCRYSGDLWFKFEYPSPKNGKAIMVLQKSNIDWVR